MNKEKKIVPQLRFPEFEKEGEWKVKKLSAVCILKAGTFVKASEIIEHQRSGLFPCYGGNGLRGYTSTFTHEGDYSLIGRQGALCGNVTFVKEKFHATEHAVVTTPKDKIDTKWLFYELVRANLNQYATGQAQPGLSVSNLENVKITVPQNPAEQQKIAACLSSLDEVITAESEKLDLLQDHKKGLLQQLFPAEGETQPKFRFPEFKDDGEWEETTLGKITKVISVRNKENKKLPVYSISNKDGFVPQSEQFEGVDSSDRGYDISLYKVIGKNTFAYNPARINIGSIGYSANLSDIIISSLYVCFKTTQNVNDWFLWYFFQTNLFTQAVSDNVEGGIRNYLFYNNFSIIKFHLPQIEEQQKIAACLSAADELIDAQAQKIEALKAHKKGLLQQLFPNNND